MQGVSEKKGRLKEAVERVMKLRKYVSAFENGVSNGSSSEIFLQDPTTNPTGEENQPIDKKSGKFT
jgi:hypothetical protein